MIDLRRTNRIKTYGNSMFPLLLDGDIVFYEKISKAELQVNDLVVIQKDSLAYTHRIIYKDKKYIITKGDNNLYADNRISYKHIVGKVKYANRNNKVINPEDIYLIQSSYYFNEIRTINEVLKSNHIQFLYLKGLPLHYYYEKVHPRRIYADCDILVSPEDFQKAINIFYSQGYKNNLSKNSDVLIESTLTKKIHNVVIAFDIHMYPAFQMTQIDTGSAFYPLNMLIQYTEELFATKRSIIIKGNRFDILSKEHLFIYLILHFFHHNYIGIERLRFIATILNKDKSTINYWDTIETIIKKYHLEQFMYPGLLLLRRYFNSFIPASLLKNITTLNYLVQKVTNFILNQSVFNGQTRLQGGMERFLLLLFLSSQPIHKKILILFQKKILVQTVRFFKSVASPKRRII